MPFVYDSGEQEPDGQKQWFQCYWFLILNLIVHFVDLCTPAMTVLFMCTFPLSTAYNLDLGYVVKWVSISMTS